MPADEAERLQALRALGILDSAAEERFNRLTRLAQQLFDVPVALVSLVDAERQWFKARLGVVECETGRDISFCGHAILGREILEVPDATLDARFAHNPLVTGALNRIRFYAGAPLFSDDGYCVGVFCIKDLRPRQLSPQQRQSLRDLADCAQNELLALRRQLTEAADLTLPLLNTNDRRSGFTSLLERLLHLSDSAFGFIGEVLHDEGAPYLKIYAISDIAWDDASRALYAREAAQGFEFRRLDTLFGAAITSGQVVLSNDPAHDPRRGGLPPGHPELTAFLGIPLYQGSEMVGLVGLGNRPGGYAHALIDFLQPLLDRVGLWIGASRNAERLRASERQLADLERIAHIGCWYLDPRKNRLRWSAEVYRLFGVEASSFRPSVQAWLELVHPDDRAAVMQAYQRSIDDGASGYTYTHRIVRPSDGAVRHIYEQCQHERDASGQVVASVGTAQDVTERCQSEQALRRAASVFEHANDAIVITDANGTIIDVNAALCRATGYERAELLVQNPRIWASGRHDADFYRQMWLALREQGLWRGELWNRRKCGEVYPALVTISPVRGADGQLQGYTGIATDLSALREQQRQVERLSQYDALTGLPNRHLLADRLSQAMALARQQQQGLALVYCDLDGFKALNDALGNEAGDRLLIALAHRLQQVLRVGDTLSRLGGDEFVAVLAGLPDAAAATPILQAMLAAARSCATDPALPLSASLGVSFYPQPDAVDADQLLRQADQAMFQAKQSGKNRYHVFDAEGDRDLRSRHAELEAIALALHQGEFVLHYQPKVNLCNGAVLGLEALVRWQHPQRGLLAPYAFLPALEQQPLMVALGDWVIDAALAQMAAWRQQGLALEVSVNVDALQLAQADFTPKLRAALQRHPQLPPQSLTLEVLETSALGDLATVTDLLHQCHELGVLTSLDDFGTGYSSLTYLKHLPTQELKIDQSFVRGLLDDPVDLAILQGVFSLAQALKRRVVAEGVETEAHGELLLRLGCAYGQGYAIAKPMAAERVPDWVAQWRPPAAWAAAATSCVCPPP
ncbi:MAG: EAL domain-containing protein [Pseudomonadota bacterium]